ncbi:MAG: hypothetical protein KC591_16905 [Gemmatimonadetes bacterium]|nr:hypothetical protein [Gemmatimonadota bacterium]
MHPRPTSLAALVLAVFLTSCSGSTSGDATSSDLGSSELVVRLDQSIRTDFHRPGDPFVTSVVASSADRAPGDVDAGASAYGRIVALRHDASGRNCVSLRFEGLLDANGIAIPLDAAPVNVCTDPDPEEEYAIPAGTRIAIPWIDGPDRVLTRHPAR